MKLLLIEDEPELSADIKTYLDREGYIIECAGDYLAASEKLNLYNYDCVLVDITLPNGNGLQLIQQLKALKSKAGIIIISAKNSLDDKINGLEIGADDYLTKPFHLSELNARLKSIIRRKHFNGSNEIIANEITIKPDERSVSVNNSSVDLTTKEFELLLYFVSNKNRVLTKNAIAEHLWGDDADQIDNHDFIYSHIKNLRKKLTEKGAKDYINTIYAFGYNFKLD
jgi:DNA-binding response OmpR family regulator